MNKVPIGRLKEVLSLNNETGELIWVLPPSNRKSVGSVAGNKSNGRYSRFQLDGVAISAHRAVWALFMGEWPPDDQQIDHINGIKTDNRPYNLRLADNSQNQSSARSACGISGVRGVHWDIGRRKWRAKIMKNYKNHHLGWFDNKDDARKAYLEASKAIHGEFGSTLVRGRNVTNPPKESE